MDKHRNESIKRYYLSGKYTTEQIAGWYKITPRQLQRIAKTEGYIRTQTEANRMVAPLKHYATVPVELRVKRKHLSRKVRYKLLSEHPYCTVCGNRPGDGYRLEVDHIDNDATNNVLTNLQVLCGACNMGKSVLDRF